ncbi:hypothetical protein QYE76_070931 [Lolium multiflorum]|uniref:Reverse transcriptase zinc-binding domain-containing protein n=1 Tax=Lolium multiflorum TaxID=4521 RepID=A0AAD8SKK7_LOLMU|nr:hypothetical protein QYE76_070931 [Lolium multiflorum]
MIKDVEAREVFDNLVNIKVGNGRNTLFWHDRLINGRVASDFAPGLCLTVTNITRNVRTVEQGLLGNVWITDFSGNLATCRAVECLQLWIAVNNITRVVTASDVFSWSWSASGVYLAKSTYPMLCHGEVSSPLSDAIWRCRATPKSMLFMWLAVRKAVRVIFSEFDETKAKPPIFPRDTRSQKGKPGGGPRPPHHRPTRPRWGRAAIWGGPLGHSLAPPFRLYIPSVAKTLERQIILQKDSRSAAAIAKPSFGGQKFLFRHPAGTEIDPGSFSIDATASIILRE